MELDHVVWAVPNLQMGIEAFEQLTGVNPVKGGVHPDYGTHNALVRIGEKSYLELLAPLRNAQSCWMKLDKIKITEIIRWAAYDSFSFRRTVNRSDSSTSD